MTKIFLSYKREDAVLVRRVAEKLRSEGFEVWWDANLETTSEDFHAQIWRQLELADAVLVCWSDAALRSPWVRSEAQWALDRRKLVSLKIAPVVLLPPFNILQTADLSSWSGPSATEAWRALTAELGDIALPDGSGAADDEDEYPLGDVDERLRPTLFRVRNCAKTACEMQSAALAAAQRADGAKARVRAGAANHRSEKVYHGSLWTLPTLYETEFRDGARNGVGVRTTLPQAEKVYRGEFRNGLREGVGVEERGPHKGGNGILTVSQIVSYAGQWFADKPSGYGVSCSYNGSELVGLDVLPEGAGTAWGVLTMASGVRIECEWEFGWSSWAATPRGLGVKWNADGSIHSQGEWRGSMFAF